MNKLFFKKTFIYFGIILLIFLADRASKLYILSVLESTGNVDININSHINLILVWNSGIGFGLLSFDKAEIYNALTILISFINVVIIYLIFKLKDIRAYFFIVILGGSLGGINTGVAAAVMPEVEAFSPVAGGAGLFDMALRTEIGGAVEAMHGRIMSPLFLGYPNEEDGSLQIIQKDRKKFQIVLLSANSNYPVINEQIKKFKPKVFIINDENFYKKKKKK